MGTFLIFIIVRNGLAFISASNIESDLAVMTRNFRDLKNAVPDAVRQFTEAMCQVMSQCCSENQSSILSAALKEGDISNAIMNMFSCRPLMKLTMLESSSVRKYFSILDANVSTDKELMNVLLEKCSTDEIHSGICDWNKFDRTDACQRRIIEKWAKDGDEVYQKNVRSIKKRCMELVAELKKALPN